MADVNPELSDFLRRARSQCDPTRAGLPADGRVRRVPGLRREEVALLAGISTDYYARLEQGRRIQPSAAVVDAVARALELDAAGRAHLADLIGRRSGAAGRRPQGVQRVRPGLRQLLDSLDGQPALLLGRRTDVLAANRMGAALFTDFERFPGPERNYTRWMFLDEQARALFADWETNARVLVENLRLDVGNDPSDRATTALVVELRSRSPEFARWWDDHRVYQRTHGSKTLHHPVVGEVTVDYETLLLPGDPDTTLYVYTTEAGSSSRQAMDILASWTLTSTTRDRSAGPPA
ncbi:helix-turn-helix transcriptional regulator [Pseudonocardia endophytica]|uniref:Helix-turn-helix protein n=1 Tax=Pseudonocardia endophytica TaxID=401976 RepID=A0A4V2PJ13_PSEEN|nr:helix-turn-helix transcriptional regulator [Pseudonocardia endophytica]TCK26766.1 helix-turn-helix protein [Pseudonocardia endophytica]